MAKRKQDQTSLGQSKRPPRTTTYDQVLAQLAAYVPPQPKTKPAFERSLADLFSEYDDEWATEYNIGITPQMFTSRNNTKVVWKCKAHGHFWLAQIADRTGKIRSGCPICSNNITLAGFNDFPTTHPQFLYLWDWEHAAFLPTTVSAGSNKYGSWKCDACGFCWDAMVNEVVSHGTGCPACGGHELFTGYNDLATIAPELVDEFDLVKNFPLSPTTTMAETKKKIWWRCRVCDHSWDAVVHPRIHRGIGCPKCKMAYSKIQKRLFHALQDTNLEEVKFNVKLPVKWSVRYSISWVDIYVEHADRMYVVEYDGGWWHNTKMDMDTRKTQALLEADYHVVRVRDDKLPSLPINDQNYVELSHVPYHSFEQTVSNILDFVHS